MEDGQHIPLNFERLSEEEMRQTADRMFERFNSRRTVRHFSAEPLPLMWCVNAFERPVAPSGAHKQPWHFCLVTDPDIKKRIRVAAEKEEYENYHGRMNEAWLDDLKPFVPTTSSLTWRMRRRSSWFFANRGHRMLRPPPESPRITTSKSRLESPVVCCCPRCTNAALRP